MNLVMKKMFNFATVGVVGLGNMGLPMAANMAAKGHQVYGFDLDASKAQTAASKNVTFCPKMTDFISKSDVLVTMLPNSQHSIEAC